MNNALAGAAIHLRKDELHLMIFMNGPVLAAPDAAAFGLLL